MKGGKGREDALRRVDWKTPCCLKLNQDGGQTQGSRKLQSQDRIYREGERQAKVLKKKNIFREMCLEKILKKTRKNSEKKISSYL